MALPAVQALPSGASLVTLDRLEAGIRHRQPALQPPAERCGWAPPSSLAADGVADGPAEGPAGGDALGAPASPGAAAAAPPAANGIHGPDIATLPAPAPDQPIHYPHHDPAQGIAFQVQRLGCEGLQVLDPRLVRIAPEACNERHRHAHESLFVVLAGRAEIRVGEAVLQLGPGGVAYVTRWLVHQSRNLCLGRELLLLAITDSGLTAAVLGDDDRQTRLRFSGPDAFAGTEGLEAARKVAPPAPTEPPPARQPLEAPNELGPDGPGSAGILFRPGAPDPRLNAAPVAERLVLIGAEGLGDGVER